MKKYITLFVLFALSIAKAQEKKDQAKDTIKTEVVKVVTSYVPKITDAFKLKQKPIITHTKETEKKKLEYAIFSVPVASTFIPKSGTMKKVDLGKRERIYDNYVSVGFGNIITPFLEGYFGNNTGRDGEYGIYTKFLLSMDPVQKTRLSSTYYNVDLDLFYKQTERYFNWEAGLNLERNKYNWYGLPSNIDFNQFTIDAIEEAQTYGFYELFGKMTFDDSYVDTLNAKVSFFSDAFSSAEFNIGTDVHFKFPLEAIHRNLNNLHVKTDLNFLGGSFNQSFESQEELNYSFFTFGVHPYYKFNVHDLSIKLGGKAFFAMDIENNVNHLLAYPDVELSYPIVKDFTNVYIGASGDLKNNSFQLFSEENPFVSPTLNITQTNERYSIFGGFEGKLGQQFSFNIKGSYTDVEDQPFFTLNYSKSDGSKPTGDNAFVLSGYEFGNSFRVLYDDTKILSVLGEVSFDGIKDLTLGARVEFNKFTLGNQIQAWNRPELKSEIHGEYKVNKWYAGTNIFFVGQRKDVLYVGNAASPFTTIDLDSYMDINLHGGYHFHDGLSVFVNLKNILDNTYQRYSNFNVQGLQAMVGVSWKFDTLF